MRIYNDPAQRNVEKITNQLTGMPDIDMAVNAAKSVLEEINRLRLPKELVFILCGPGGNGGDGFALAILLARQGVAVKAVLCAGKPKAETTVRLYSETLRLGIPVADVSTDYAEIKNEIRDASMVVDCVFGIGNKRPLDEACANLFQVVNNSNATRLAVDVPSGVCSDSGLVLENAFKADLTVCLIGLKPASVYKTSKSAFGRILTTDAGQSSEALSRAVNTWTMDRRLIGELLPRRKPDSYKGTFGKLTMIAGSRHFRGAASIAAMGGYLAGAGLVDIISDTEALNTASVLCPEAIFTDISDVQAVERSIAKATTILIGCGMESGKRTKSIVTGLIRTFKGTLILDAESLNSIMDDPNILHERPGSTIITPHLGEFSRLTGLSVKEILNDRITAAQNFAVSTGVITVLKSENTVIALPNCTNFVDLGGSTGLAKAASGDLLAGLIAGFVAGGAPAEDAAKLGVLTHTEASKYTEKEFGIYSMTATDVAKHVPHVLASASNTF
ncbi:MAG: NAD(P)H-hydrate dehydratase [Oscillospiraceae bacterium]|nr:NAD(P)H-hydrate dehydratase [Oscillospiraceae bacterium]